MQRDAHAHEASSTEQVLAARMFLLKEEGGWSFVWEDHRTSNRILKISPPVFVIPMCVSFERKRGLLLVEVAKV